MKPPIGTDGYQACGEWGWLEVSGEKVRVEYD